MSVLSGQIESVRTSMPYGVVGQVEAISGLTIEAAGLPLPLGALCRIKSLGGQTSLAEVIGFRAEHTLLMALSPPRGVARTDRVENLRTAPQMWCSDALLGRVLNGYGEPIDGKGRLLLCEPRRIDGRGAAPLTRRGIDEPIVTSIRAIDALHTCGMGQRMGIFSGPGVGKSMLIAQIARYSSADVSVIALVGERGREVQDFLANALGAEGLKRCVLIVSTSDDPPLLRVRAVRTAATVCEYFREQGKNVLFLVDSLTRMCHAQRQIGLAAREPPATKGFPPSVFALLPEILERAGKTERGSITGFYSVLVEADDFNEPIADAVKGIVDGHVWLSRALANRGHFPAVDVLQSISRVRGDVVESDQLEAAKRVLGLMAIYQDIEDLVNIGAYVPGTNGEFDLAVQSRPRIMQFLQQKPTNPATLEQSKKQLMELVAWIEQMDKSLRAQAAKSAGRVAAR
ncbi:MAG: FliI/YscN family ATPase [Planctomycetota bacterium]|nr:FliI/YscN family ATPase [Planctomycetota bacterium]